MSKKSVFFWIKVFVFFLFIFFIDLFAGKILFFMQNKSLENSPFAMVTEFTMWKVDKEIILIGASETSHGYKPSIIEDSLKMTVYNCGKDGYGFYYQSSMIDGILKRYSPKIIVWSVSPSSFLSKPSKDSMDRISYLNPFYNSNEYIKSIIIKKGPYEKYKMYSQLYVYNSRIFPYAYKALFDYNNFEKGGFSPLINTNNNYPVVLDITYDDNLDNEIAKLFASTLEKCKAAGTQVVLVFPPKLVKDNYNNTIQYKKLKQIAENFDTQIFENFYNHNDFINNPLLFKDNLHLNNKGASKFSSLFSRELKHLITNEL